MDVATATCRPLAGCPRRDADLMSCVAGPNLIGHDERVDASLFRRLRCNMQTRRGSSLQTCKNALIGNGQLTCGCSISIVCSALVNFGIRPRISRHPWPTLFMNVHAEADVDADILADVDVSQPNVNVSVNINVSVPFDVHGRLLSLGQLKVEQTERPWLPIWPNWGQLAIRGWRHLAATRANSAFQW